MVIQNQLKFFENENTSKISKSFANPHADVMSLQVYGDANAFNVYIEGKVNSSGEWIPLAGINLTSFAVSANGISTKGIYEFGVVGIREIRARLENSDGQISVFGQLISTEET